VLFPIALIFVPPVLGFYESWRSFGKTPIDSLILGAMSLFLFLLILVPLLARKKSTDELQLVDSIQESVLAPDLDEFGTTRRWIGAILAIFLIVSTWFLNIGLFTGFVLFLLEFIIIILLKKLDIVGDRRQAPKVIQPS
jgi:quinol-cytochrome oxidoreductase complex cytochrome b subunit